MEIKAAERIGVPWPVLRDQLPASDYHHALESISIDNYIKAEMERRAARERQAAKGNRRR